MSKGRRLWNWKIFLLFILLFVFADCVVETADANVELQRIMVGREMRGNPSMATVPS